VVRSVAFYLPQYHPIAENDRAWGEGFTDWTNVAKSRPLFTWHEQPHVPSELGFYDLRDPRVREQQAALARAYGIHGFCYYHYWFAGRRLLERPFDEVLASGTPDFPFMLCWANENWTRAWDGGATDIIVPQQYSMADHSAHAEWLCRAFADPRYIRVDGKPIFLVYRASEIPNLRRVADMWRAIAEREGIGEIVLGRVESFPSEVGDPRVVGFDLAIDFQPAWSRLGPGSEVRAWVHEYEAVMQQMLARPAPSYPLLPCVTPGFDNTARRQRPLILRGSTPALYERWLGEVVHRPRSTDLVFINAWNEWAEGNHLEPCERWSRAYLESTLRVIRS